jgi:hypothetical protein
VVDRNNNGSESAEGFAGLEGGGVVCAPRTAAQVMIATCLENLRNLLDLMVTRPLFHYLAKPTTASEVAVDDSYYRIDQNKTAPELKEPALLERLVKLFQNMSFNAN